MHNMHAQRHISNKLHCLTERDSRLAHYFALLWVLGLCLGYLATFCVKSDVIFLLGDPVFARAYYRSSLWYSVSSVVCRL